METIKRAQPAGRPEVATQSVALTPACECPYRAICKGDWNTSKCPASKGSIDMPIITVKHAHDSLDPDGKARLAQGLTEVLIRMEGGAGTPGGRAFAWVLFERLPEGDFWVGGASDTSQVAQPGPFLAHVTIPEGYMNATHKADVHKWVTEAILIATGAREADGAGILVVIDEVPEGNWGWRGHPISIESIADSVGLSKTGSRFAWVESYFAAKARLLDAFAFPKDLGGLPPSKVR